MSSAWRVLRRGGVPLAGPREGPCPSERELAAAVREVRAEAESRLDARERDALAAFLIAWRHHFAASFAASFGDEAGALERWAFAQLDDANRYLKLRRIAIANLSTVL